MLNIQLLAAWFDNLPLVIIVVNSCQFALYFHWRCGPPETYTVKRFHLFSSSLPLLCDDGDLYAR